MDSHKLRIGELNEDKNTSMTDSSTQTDTDTTAKHVNTASCQIDPDNDHNTTLSEQIEDIVKVINLKWNNNCYVKPSHETGNPLSTELNTIVIADSGNQPTQNRIKKD